MSFVNNHGPVHQPRETFTVVYRTGGPAKCVWKRTLPWSSEDIALRSAEGIERGGRLALVFRTSKLDAIGMPEGWDWCSGPTR